MKIQDLFEGHVFVKTICVLMASAVLSQCDSNHEFRQTTASSSPEDTHHNNRPGT